MFFKSGLSFYNPYVFNTNARGITGLKILKSAFRDFDFSSSRIGCWIKVIKLLNYNFFFFFKKQMRNVGEYFVSQQYRAW